MNTTNVKILFSTIFLFGFITINAQDQSKTKTQAVYTPRTSYKETVEKQMTQWGEPYLSWSKQNTDSLPINFNEQIADLNWPLEDYSHNVQPNITKEQYYKGVFNSVRQSASRELDPVWEVIANNPLSTACGDGDFEADSLNPPSTEWYGAWGSIISGNNDPTFGSYTAGFVPSTGINYAMSCAVHHSIVPAGNDPMVGSLLQTTASSSSNYSFRIGNSCNGYSSEVLSKKFVVTGSGIIKFSYALVFENPDNHAPSAQPSFWVKVYDSIGNLIPGLVYLDITAPPQDFLISSNTNPFFQNGPNSLKFIDWACAKIDLSQYVGQKVSVALITTDCAFGGHFGYGYVDNWCGNCEGSTTGTVDVSIADSCIVDGTPINVNYTLPVIGTDTGSVSLTLTFYYNGSPLSYTLASPTLNTDGTYTFLINPDSLPCNGSGYDVVATANYAVGPAMNQTFYSITSPDPFSSSGNKPGMNNDLVCCVSIAEICDSTDANLVPTLGDCCYQVQISNTYSNNYFTGVSITSDNLSISSVSNSNSWGTISYQTPTQVVYSQTMTSNGIPLDTSAFQVLGNICFSGSGPSNITISFIGPAPLFDTICAKTIVIPGCVQPIDTNCVAMDTLTAVCESGVIKMKFKIKNNSAFTMRGLHLYSQNPDVSFSPIFVPIPDLLPNQTSVQFIETTLIVSNNASNMCFFVSACDQNTPPGQDGIYPNFCCMDSILYCVQIPACSACDGITISAAKQDSVNCCYNLTLSSNYTNANIGTLEFTGLNGTQFAVFTNSGWGIVPPVSSSYIKIKAFGAGVPAGVYPNFASFCLTGSSSPPHQVVINYKDVNGVFLCSDTLILDSCQLVQPTCANIVSDSLYCSGDKIQFTFSVQNNASFPLYQVDFRTTDSSVVLDRTFMQIIPPIAPGNTGGPYTVTIDSAAASLSQFCMYLTGHNGIYDSINGLAATQCCTDSLGGICLPMITCGDTTICDTTVIIINDTTIIGGDTIICCCQFGSLTIANGITPNGDGKNDVFVINRPLCCDYISIEVYNRWGNVVYANPDYQNDWAGLNNSGQRLVQGTYFVVIQLPDGSKKTTYLDIRY
jgi:gliding motility-associated-like protein